MPLHSSLGDRAKLHLKKKNKRKKRKRIYGQLRRIEETQRLKMTGSQLDSHSHIKPKHAEAGLGGDTEMAGHGGSCL